MAAATHLTTVEEHPADTLVRDERVQRTVIPQRVKELSNTLDLDAIGAIIVSRRLNDKLVLLDGQHRVLALIEAGVGEWPVRCIVYHGLTLEQEASLFRRLNNTRKPTAVDDYLKGVIAGDHECREIAKLLTGVGLRVAKSSDNGVLACVSALRGVYRSLEGPTALTATIETIVAAWGTRKEALEGHIVTGLGRVFLHYGEQIDRKALADKLAKFPGGPAALIGRAKGLRELRPGTIGQCVAVIVVDTYNYHRRDQLPPL